MAEIEVSTGQARFVLDRPQSNAKVVLGRHKVVIHFLRIEPIGSTRSIISYPAVAVFGPPVKLDRHG